VPTVYVVPGLGGTTLGFDPGGGRPLWVDYTRIALGNIGAMRLAPDGVSPGPPDGRPLFPGEPLADYYGPCVEALRTQLVSGGYIVRTHGYDWRLQSEITGAALAARIRAETTPGIPCSLVCHSFGGIVARAAYAALVGTGDAGLVRRIITLGSPHQGSYGVVALWSLDSDQLSQVQQLTLLTSTLLSLISPLVAPFPWSKEALVRLSATWPALYETLPLLNSPDSESDPNRAVVFGSTWPVDRAISQGWLDVARLAFQPRLFTGPWNPPARVMTSVAGTGTQTPAALHFPGLLGIPVAYNTVADGDGTVTVASALLASSAMVKVAGRHTDLPNQMGIGGQLAGLVLAERPDPPPPVMAIAGPFNPQLAGPPFPQKLAGLSDC
jgi:hypothetical protein